MKKLFSVPGGFLVVMMLCIGISINFQMDAFNTVFWVSLGWFCYGKLAIAMFFTQGYGVKKGVRIVAGMPMSLAILILIIASINAVLLHTAYQLSELHPQTIANIKVFGWVAASGVATAICHWYFYAHQAYFYQSEYNIRMECKLRDDPPEITNKRIDHYRKIGVIQ